MYLTGSRNGNMNGNTATLSSELSRKEQYWEHNFKFALAKESLRFGPLPPIRGYDKIPECLISITDMKKITWPGAFVHCFKDDYKFDTRNGVWYGTDRLIQLAKRKRMGILTPDFSTYSDSHPEICRWNLFRSRLIGYEAEMVGVPVVATIMWWDDESIDYALQGLPPGRVYAVSTMNVARRREDQEIFGRRIRHVCAVLKPNPLLVYGSSAEIDWGGQRIHEYPNGTYDWTRRNESKNSIIAG